MVLKRNNHRILAVLLALMLLQDSRRAARVDDTGAAVLLADQDRTAWDAVAIAEAVALAQDLSTDDSASFVNGLLARLADLG